jgi:hypothetical protein
MCKLLLPVTFVLIALLAACQHDSAPQQATQTSTSTAPRISETSAAPAAPSDQYAPAPSNGQGIAPGTPGKPSAFQPVPPVPPVQPAAIVIPAGTPVRVRLDQTIDTKRNRPGDHFEATLVSPVAVNGQLVIPGGTTFVGHVAEAKPSGRFKGRAVLGVELDSFRLNGVVYRVVTGSDTRVSGRHRRRNWILMGGGSGLGATLGAVAGGGAGALIGAGAGAGAGAVGAFFTGRKNVSLTVETPLTFRLRADVTLTTG